MYILEISIIQIALIRRSPSKPKTQALPIILGTQRAREESSAWRPTSQAKVDAFLDVATSRGTQWGQSLFEAEIFSHINQGDLLKGTDNCVD